MTQLTFIMSTADSFLYFTSLPDMVSAIHAVEDISGKDIPATVRYFASKDARDLIENTFELRITGDTNQGMRMFGLTDENRIAFDAWQSA